jgi:demethylmenaquinone methyltransferase/2-methoxy-6-polyprenyl-1,4-benzoquinol methylase
MPVIDHFGLIAPFYDRVIPVRYAEKIIQMSDLPVDGLILDAGGGTGRVAEVVKPYAMHTFVSDLSMKMLRQAQEKDGLGLACAHAEYLPFPSDCFDRVIMIDALHHVCDHQETAQEMWRVLKPGGKAIIVEPDIREFSVKLVALAEKIALMRSHFISPKKIAGLFNYPQAIVNIEKDGFNAWVIIEKDQGLPEQSDHLKKIS